MANTSLFLLIAVTYVVASHCFSAVQPFVVVSSPFARTRGSSISDCRSRNANSAAQKGLLSLRAEGNSAGSDDGNKPNKKGWLGLVPKVDKAQLAALGASAALSYGFVSNINMGICVIAAWVTFGKTYGLSPLDPGQWPKFLAVYGGYWIAANFLRPFRMAIAVGLAPTFDKLVSFLQNKLRLPKAGAFATTVFFVNVVGNLTFLFGGLILTTSVLRVPFLATNKAPIAIVQVKK